MTLAKGDHVVKLDAEGKPLTTDREMFIEYVVDDLTPYYLGADGETRVWGRTYGRSSDMCWSWRHVWEWASDTANIAPPGWIRCVCGAFSLEELYALLKGERPCTTC